MCLECGTDASDFSAHYPTHVRCLLCPYSSCCSRAYAAHMIHHHVPKTKDQDLPLHKLPPPCVYMLRCSDCDFKPRSADHMAEHLLNNQSHYSATCGPRSLIDRDIQFWDSEDQRPSEEKDPAQDKDSPEPSWRSADCWEDPTTREVPEPSILPFTQSCGPLHALSRNSDAIDFFNLLFPAALIELIATETNAHVKTSQYLGSGSQDWVPITTHEVKGFIGLVVLMGIQNLPDPTHYWSWSHYDNSYTFYRAMSYKRFKQIAANIRMGSFTTEEHRGTLKPHDPLHIFRPMLDILGTAMWTTYRANCCLTIDRALLPSQEDGESSTKGNPKTQPQVWLLCDSKSGYCHRLFIQVGEKAGEQRGFTVVPELVKGLEDRHHQLYLANSLTSIPLMQKLLDQGIYASSSFPPPNPILPRELWDQGQLEKPGDFVQRQCGPLLATRWRDTKEMGCLSTNAAPGEADAVWRRSQTTVGGLDPIDRPMAFRLLQENMRGVDICKQLLACNPLGGIPQDRHWRSLFWFLVNLSIVNAFIVLRESRKDNPPPWVQEGLFTQVNFRKRLGNQLAKCAQKYFENMEIAGSRATRPETTEEPQKQRHRMTKISSISKRCKNCNLKNIRRESVNGCMACKANLCKESSCFWEFHGLSPLNRGSTKVGFVKDRISGAIEVPEVRHSQDDAMAPVEDFDFSDSERLDDLDDMDPDLEDPHEDFKEEEEEPHFKSSVDGLPLPAGALPGSKERDDFLTARQLRIALSALCDGFCQASRVFSTETQLIRTWLKEAKKHFRKTKQDLVVQSSGEDRMVAWVLSMWEQQLPITESNLFHKASTLRKKGGFSDSFRISYDWAVSFMLRHRLALQSASRTATLARSLPPPMEAKIKTFRDFTQKVFKHKKLSERTVAAMDELSLFVDLRLVQNKVCRADALELTGSIPLLTVYLTVLADGTMLPSLILSNRQLDPQELPESVLLEAGPESLSAEEALDLWFKKVWLPYLSGLMESSKSMLVLDRHREHTGEPFLVCTSGSGTLPAVIPGGCSPHLQPLEICMKPVLQRLLLSRWAKYIAANPRELEETPPLQLQAKVAQKLVDWLIEALTHLNQLQQLWRKSFRLTGLLTVPERTDEDEEAMIQAPEDIQQDLLKTLSETLLGTDSLEDEALEMFELEDGEEEEEGEVEKQEQEGGDKEEDKEEESLKETKEDGLELGKETRGDEETKRHRDQLGEETEEDREEIKEGIKKKREDGSQEGGEKREIEKKEDSGEGKEVGKDDKETEKEKEEDSEEEGKVVEEDRKEEARKEARRETRIVIGEEVGDEWKITVKSRTDGSDGVEGEGEDRMDES